MSSSSSSQRLLDAHRKAVENEKAAREALFARHGEIAEKLVDRLIERMGPSGASYKAELYGAIADAGLSIPVSFERERLCCMVKLYLIEHYPDVEVGVGWWYIKLEWEPPVPDA